MKAILRILALAAVPSAILLAQSPSPAPASAHAIPPREQKFFYHYEWTRGAVLTSQEWQRGAAIDPRRHGLPAPPAADQWREIDRNYVLVSRSTHAIVRVVAAPHPTVPGRSGGQP